MEERIMVNICGFGDARRVIVINWEYKLYDIMFERSVVPEH